MNLNPDDYLALWLTIKLAVVTTTVLMLIGGPLAWWLARSRHPLKFLVETIVAMPLVLPPTVLGFYLLLILSPQSVVGETLSYFNIGGLVFSFSGLVIGSCIYSLPFVVQPLQNTFAAIPTSTLEVAATLGASPYRRFISVILPLSRHGIIGAGVLGFAHTLGEFGVVLMIGGNISGQTKVASIAIYDHVESLQYEQAHWLSAVMLLMSFALLVIVFATKKRTKWSSL